jgi:hypothetical protein
MIARPLGTSFLLVLIAWTLSGCGSSSNRAAPSGPAITEQPANQAVTVGQEATFTVSTVSNTPVTYQWQRNDQPISGANHAFYTIPVTMEADDAADFNVVVTNPSGQVTSSSATLSVHPPPDVLTFHNDNMRTGQNQMETYLTPRTVSPALFGKIGFLATDGKVDAQPLFLAGVQIGNATHNVLYVATEHDSVYAYDADTQALLWQATTIGAGETTSDDRQCPAATPEIGITSTPAIDRTRGSNGAIYVVAATEDASDVYHHRIHALDITTGAELFGGPTEIQAQYAGAGSGTNGVNVIFDPSQYFDRAALLASNGVIYTSWASHCDVEPYTSWVMGFDEVTLQQTRVLNLTPNGEKGGIWMSGGGPAADADGNVYLLGGNGTFDTTLNSNGFPNQNDFGNAIVKIPPTAPAAVADFFAPFDTGSQSDGDYDLGSGGVLLLPDQVDDAGQTRHVALGSGKTGWIYVVDRDNMGKFNPSVNNIFEEIPRCCGTYGGLFGPIYSTPAYFNSTVYFGSQDEPLEAFAVSNAKLSLPFNMRSVNTYPYPGATPSISANGTKNGILWAVENGTTGILHAYDATNLSVEYYNSGSNPTRDQFGSNKFIVPTIVNGKVYVGTPSGVAVFGILPLP